MAQLSSTRRPLREAIEDVPADVLRDVITECCSQSEIVAHMLTSKLFPEKITSEDKDASGGLSRAEIACLKGNQKYRTRRVRIPVAVCPLLSSK